MVEIKTTVIPPLDDLLALYNDVGWTGYSVAPQELRQAYEASLSAR